jgi:hypothetical protein
VARNTADDSFFSNDNSPLVIDEGNPFESTMNTTSSSAGKQPLGAPTSNLNGSSSRAGGGIISSQPPKIEESLQVHIRVGSKGLI